MKTSILKLFILIGLLSIRAELLAQYSPATQSCINNCFSTEIIKAEKNGACTNYEFKVSYSGKCDHALSHFTVAIPCGDVKNLSNSKGWKQVYGYDPTTKLTGFKIDNIPNFGETSLKSFTIKFTLCPDGGKCSNNRSCVDELKCWEPVVAYKAATCVFYDTLKNSSCQNLAASLQQKDASCFGATDGALSVIVTEGVAPYKYIWSTEDTTASILNRVAGNYSVTVRDASGTELILNGTISQPASIVISETITNASCNGRADGAIDLTVSGGNAVYTYSWSNGATTQDLTALKSEMYNVTVRDSIGCSIQKSFNLVNTSQILITATSTLPACSQSNGGINITVSGGLTPYTYQWSNGATTEDIQNVSAGIYKVTVTDASECSTELLYSLRENNTLKLSSVVTQTTCLDDGSGAIDLIVSGGTAPYTYLWTNGATTQDLTDLLAGIYKVTVTDANGCSIILAISVSKKTFQVDSQVLQPLCHNGDDGSIVLTPSGGVEPYTYVWSNGLTGNSITGIAPGVYKVTITDATGCSRLLTYTITNPSPITLSASISNAQCNAEGSYNIDLTVAGGKSPYTYVWSNGATTEDLNSLQSGTYTVIIKDTNGCSTTKDVVVSGSAAGWSCLITQPDSAAICGSMNNALATSVAGATSYQWTVQSSDSKWIITNDANGQSIVYTAGDVNSTATFTLTIIKDGCTQTCSYTATTCTVPDDGGGGNGGGDGGENNETCDECFDSSVVLVSTDGSCKTYEVTVSTDGNCQHELSHWDVAIPCGNVTNMWNSGGWKMELGTDPTTGIAGLKVDGVNGFGKESATFKVKFTICGDNSCNETLKDWDPIVAYKAELCIAIDTLGHGDHSGGDDGGVKVCAYPNPFHGNLKFDWKCDEDDYVELDIIDKCGKQVHQVYKGNVWKGESYSFECGDNKLNDDFYIYRFTCTKNKTQYGKLLKLH
ncbi:MAG: SprB repeat-containing protein [Chryseolinea sp.]